MKNLKWLVVVVISLYYCASPISYSRARIHPGVQSSLGGTILVGSGRLSNVTSCAKIAPAREVPFFALQRQMEGELIYGITPNFALTAHSGIGWIDIYSKSKEVPRIAPTGYVGVGMKAVAKFEQDAVAYQFFLGSPLITQRLSWEIESSGDVIFTLQHVLLGSGPYGFSQEISFWTTVHTHAAGVWSVGLGHLSSPSSIEYTYFFVGTGWTFP